jgi:signal transduction histidine kinase
MVCDTMWNSVIDILPRGNTLEETDWQRRHTLLLWVLLAHVPVLAIIGVAMHNPALPLAAALTVILVCAGLGYLLRGHRRLGSGAVTLGLVWCSTALVGLTGGSIEAHFHFFIIIGFIALYQDWVPFLLNVVLTVVSHGVGSMWLRTLMFNHPAAQQHPWTWSIIHGVAVLLACVGVMLFWRVTEDEQNQKDALTRQLADAEINRRRFTSDMLVNLARRNQTMLYRQLEIINQLEESERNPDALAELFRLDHLTTRVRRNAENLLVLSGEKPPRVWSQPVPLRDVVRAAIAETEDLDRVVYEIPEGPLVDGSCVTDLTHLLAELTENAVRFSPPDMAVTIRSRRDPRGGQGQLLTVEDWGVGMDQAELAEANVLLGEAPEIDLSVSKRLGFHVVARLAARHAIRVSLCPTPGSGVTASVTLPGQLFDVLPEPVGALPAVPATAARPGRPSPRRAVDTRPAARAGTAPVLVRSAPERREPALVGTARTAAPPTPGVRDDAGPERAAAGLEHPFLAEHAVLPIPRLPLPGEIATSGAATAARHAAVLPSPVPRTDDGATAADAEERAEEAPAPAALVSIPPQRSAPRVEQLVGVPADPPASDGADAPTPGRRLRRRVPQASLAPGLRVIPAELQAEIAPPPSATEALSRYQASRAAARSVVEDGAGDDRDGHDGTGR